MALKADANEIRAFMQQWASRLDQDRRRHWPNWLYRSDHVENAAAILNRNLLLSRAVAESEGVIPVDSGSPQYISQLSADQRTLVRLYFRPKTPTQYANEGIRPKNRIEYGAHMPVPIYLLFSSTLLEEEGVSFSKGRLTQVSSVGETYDFLKSIEFSDVYHDGAVGRLGESERRSEILNARHSEVLVKKQLSLKRLKHVVCRSGAERETLVNLLNSEAYDRWKDRLQVDTGLRPLFHRRGTFVQRADLSGSRSRFVFHSGIPVDMRGPFDLDVEWIIDGYATSVHKQDFIVQHTPVEFVLNRRVPEYQVKVFLNADLAYFGRFDEAFAAEVLF